jgi:hypothetical protein
MEKFSPGEIILWNLAKGEYRPGASYVCTDEFVPDPVLENPEFIIDGLPPQYNGKQTYSRIDRNIYRCTR